MTNPSGRARTPAHRGFRIAARTVLTTATAAAFLGAASLSASAAPNDTAVDSVTANVNVDSTITLTVDQTSFDLDGTGGTTVTETNQVTGTVTTNNQAGYSVGVLAAAAALVPADPLANTDTIPIGNLSTHNADNSAYVALSTTVPVITTTKATRSALAGDAFSDDYEVVIPDVNSDTYSVTLDYTATALA